MAGDAKVVANESAGRGSIHVESAIGLIGQALVLLSNLAELGALESSQRLEIRAAMNRLWLAIRELEQGTTETKNALM